MKKSLDEQKELLIESVLELQKKLRALKYLLAKGKEADKPEIKVAIGIFNDFFFFIHNLLWESIVINLSWLYDKKGDRSLYWYLAQVEKHNPSLAQKVEAQIKEIDVLENEIKKVKRVRNKWVAHKDSEPFEKFEEFWEKQNKPVIEEVEKLVELASNIVQIECEIIDTTSSGIHKIFALTHLIVHKKPDFLQKMKEYNVLERLNYSELQEIYRQVKQQ